MNNLQFIKHLINTSGFTKFPPVEVEDQFVPSTDDHIEREKETGKFLKKLRKDSPFYEMIWVECLSLQKSLQDLDYLLKTSITDKSLMSILYTYALFDLRQQRINRELKKIEKSHPKVFDYYRDDKEILDTNIFRIFEQDIEDILKDTEKRYVDYKQKYHDDNFNHLTLTKDDILSQYKKAIKYIKKNPKKFL